MNTLQTLQSVSTPHAESSPPTMNTTQPTFPQRRKPAKRLNSGALMRRDQEVNGHARLGVVGDERTQPKASQRYGEFGTIGSKLSRPTR
jgi:hypothetical protein